MVDSAPADSRVIYRAAEQSLAATLGKHWRGRSLTADDLENFRNNGMTAGLDGCSQRDGTMPDRLSFGNTLTFPLYAQVVDIAGRSFVEEMLEVGPGNPAYAEFDGLKLTITDLQAVYDAWRISQHCEAPQHIVEIGPGFGALSVMLRKLYPDAHITLVDLPEHEIFQSYYIDQTVGLDGFDITFEPPANADLVIALRCMMEFEESVLDKYFSWLQALDGLDYFYLVTRYWKRNALKHYPFDGRWRPVVSKASWPFAHMHEFFLERTTSSSDELQRVLQSLPPYILRDRVIQYAIEPKFSVVRINGL